MSLIELESGKKAIVKNITGGHGIHQKLDAMGIKSGSQIVKVNQQLLKGPIVINVYNSQVAIGHGMAAKIIVEQI